MTGSICRSERDFDGLKARWFCEVNLPKNMNVHEKGSTAYKPTTVARKSTMGFDKGKPVFILEDPQGNPWVMQAASLIVDPSETYDSLKDLGSKLKLAPGWKFRINVIDQAPSFGMRFGLTGSRGYSPKVLWRHGCRHGNIVHMITYDSGQHR